MCVCLVVLCLCYLRSHVSGSTPDQEQHWLITDQFWCKESGMSLLQTEQNVDWSWTCLLMMLLLLFTHCCHSQPRCPNDSARRFRHVHKRKRKSYMRPFSASKRCILIDTKHIWGFSFENIFLPQLDVFDQAIFEAFMKSALYRLMEISAAFTFVLILLRPSEQKPSLCFLFLSSCSLLTVCMATKADARQRRRLAADSPSDCPPAV